MLTSVYHYEWSDFGNKPTPHAFTRDNKEQSMRLARHLCAPETPLRLKRFSRFGFQMRQERFRVVMVMHPGFDCTEFRDLRDPLKPFAPSLEVTHMPNSAGSGDSQLCRSSHRQRVQDCSPSTTSATSQTTPSSNTSNWCVSPDERGTTDN